MPTAQEWWRRAAAAAKDRQALCLIRVAAHRNPHMEAALIRATSHDKHSLDYTNARRVFAWARTHPVMWTLSRRASRTRSWAVALKALLIAHGLLLLSSAPSGRLPFDLSDFRDRSSGCRGFSSFVQAYFNFLDHRSILLTNGKDDDVLEKVEKMQALLELLMRIRPYADGMDVWLILEAIDCAVIEVFNVYSRICRGIASFLVDYMKNGEGEGLRRRGLLGIRILRRAAEQNEQLSSYFDMCRGLGVGNAAMLPPVQRFPEEDIRVLEEMVMTAEEREKTEEMQLGTVVVVAKKWVVFDGDGEEGEAGSKAKGCLRRSLDGTTQPKSWASMVQVGNLIDL